MTFSGFRYYRAQTVSPNNEYIFEQVTLCWLIVLAFSFFPFRRYLEARRKMHQSQEGSISYDKDRRMKIANKPDKDVSMAMNYAPFIDVAKSHDGAPPSDQPLASSREPQVEEQGVQEGQNKNRSERKPRRNLINILPTLRPSGWRKEEQDERILSLKSGNDKVATSQPSGKKKEPSYTPNEAIEGKYVAPRKQRYDDAPIVMSRKHDEANTTYMDSIDNATTMSEFSQEELAYFSFEDGGTLNTAASFGRKGMAVLLGADDHFDERERQVVEVLPHENDRGGWDNIVIYQTSIFQVNPFATRNVLHDASGPFFFECGRCIDEGYESDSSDDDSCPQFLPCEDFDDDLPDYGTQPWDALPPDVKLAAETLGIDQSMWAAKVKPDIFKKHWDELTISQQAACVQLGLTKRKWEQRFVLDDFQLPTYEAYRWQDLPPNAVAAAEVLGYSKKMWDNNQDSEVCKKRWKELSEEQKAASLALLGFDKVSWDANWLTEKVHHDQVRCQRLLNTFSWQHLPRDAKIAAKAVGYSREIWNKVRKPPISALQWDLMNPRQRAAWFQLIVSIKARKEQVLYLKSIQRTQNKEASEDSVTEQSICDGLAVHKETRNLLRLTCTAAVANLGKPILHVLLIGMILGTTGAYIFVAWIMVNFLLDMCEFATAGFIEAEESMCRQAIAVRKYFQAAQQVQLSLGLCTLVMIPIYFLTIFLVDDILVGFSFGGTVAQFAGDYIPLAVLSRLIQGCLANGLNRLMWNDGRGGTMVKLELLAKFIQFAFLLIMLAGLQIDSITGIGLIEVGGSILYTVLIYNKCEDMGWLEKYEKGLLEYWSLQNKPWAGEFVKMSIPLNTGHILSHGHWLIWTWFAVAMGPAEAAAWIIMQAVGAVLVVLPTAITNATEIQIGLSIGSGRTDDARQIAFRSLLYVAIAALLPVTLFFGFQDPIIGVFTNDWSLVIMIQSLVPLVCTGTVIHALASHSHMILVSIGRVKTGVIIFYVGTYCLSVPMACVMVFGAKFGLQSLMMSVVIGSSIIAFTNLLAVYSSDWSSLSRTVLMKAEKHCKALIDTTEYRAPPRKELEMC